MIAAGVNPLGDCIEAMSVPGFVAVVTQGQVITIAALVTVIVFAAFIAGRGRR